METWVPFSRGQALLGPEFERHEPDCRERLAGEAAPALVPELPDTDHSGREMGQRRQITGRADGALAGDHRNEVSGQALGKVPDHVPADPGGALGETCHLQCQGEPRDGPRQRLADPGAMRQHDVALQGREVGAGNADGSEFPETRVDAVNRIALGHDGRHHGGRGLDPRPARLVEHRVGTEIDVPPEVERDRTGYDDPGFHFDLPPPLAAQAAPGAMV